MNSKQKYSPLISDILLLVSVLNFLFTIPWGFMQFLFGRGWDWLVLSLSALYIFAGVLHEQRKEW